MCQTDIMKYLVVLLAITFVPHVNSDCFEDLEAQKTFESKPQDGVVHNYANLSEVNIINVDSKYVKLTKNPDGITGVLELIMMQKYHEETESNNNIKDIIFDIEVECITNAALPNKMISLTITLLKERIYKPHFIDSGGIEVNQYELTLPMPFPKLPITLFEVIRAKDIDIYNEDLTFSVEDNSGFTVVTKRDDPTDINKIYAAEIIPLAVITNDVTFKLTVSDNYADATSQETKTVDVVITKDKSSSVISFTNTHYTGSFNVENLQLSTITPAIKITSDTANINLENTYADCFKGENLNGDVRITLNPTQCINLPFQEDLIQLKITATSSGNVELASALLSLDITRKSFDQGVYIYEHDNSASSTLTGIMLSNANNDVKLKVEPASSEVVCLLENASAEPKPIKCTLALGIFPSGERHQEFTLSAYYDTKPNSETTTKLVIIALEENDLPIISFNDNHYSGSFNVEILQLSTITPAIEINSDTANINLENTYADCFKGENLNGDVHITLNPTQCINLPFQEDLIQLKITTTSSGNVELASALLSLDITRKSFDQGVYIHEHDNSASSTLTGILLSNANNDVELKVEPDSSGVSCLLENASLEPKPVECTLPLGIFPSGERHQEFTLSAYYDTKPNSETTTKLVIIAPDQNIPSSLQFSELVYQAKFNNKNHVIEGDLNIKLLEANDLSTVKVTIDQKYENMFKPELDHSSSIVTLKVLTTDFDESVRVITFVISAEEDSTIVRASITLEIIHENPGDDTIIEFTDEIYVGQLYSKDLTLSIAEISLQTTNLQNVNVNIDPAEEDRITATLKKDTQKVQLTVKDEAVFPEEETMISFVLHANAEDASGYTIVSLEVIHPNEEEKDKLAFQDYKVAHQLVFENILNEEIVVFKTNSNDPSDIEYSISPAIPEVTIGKTDGKVVVTTGIEPEVHEFTVKAKSIRNRMETKGPLVLVIERKIIEDEVKPYYSHVIADVLEDQDTDQLVLDLPEYPGLDYGYCIEKLSPDIEGMFEVDQEKKIQAKRLLREADYFDSMAVPQFTMTVQVMKKSEIPDDGNCPKDNSKTRTKREIFEGILMEQRKTPAEPMKTIISVIIKDINNNPPIAIEPNQVVCYPNRDLVEYLRPPYLSKVHATDKDTVKDYGRITYVSKQPEFVEVNPTTGEVYPTQAMYDDTILQFQIKAYDDENINNPDHFTEFHITVKVVDEAHLATIEIEMKVEQIEAFLESISTKDVVVKALTIEGIYENLPPVLPNIRNRTIKDGQDPEPEPIRRKTKAVVYALKNKEPLTVEEIITLFAEVKEVNVNKLEIPGYGVQPGPGDGGTSDTDNTGLIAAVSVLAVLLVAVIIAFIIWYRKSKKTVIIPYNTSTDVNSSDGSPKLSFQNKQDRVSVTSFSSNKSTSSIKDVEPNQQIEFVKNPHRDSGNTFNKKMERRATGYVLNPFPIPEDNNEIEYLKEFSKTYGDSKLGKSDLESVMSDATMDTGKSVTFNSDVITSELYVDGGGNNFSIDVNGDD